MNGMTIWIVAIFLTLAAAMALGRPLLRKPVAGGNAAAYDREVYKDQLEELERDEARGLISGREAEEARAEIGRRLLKADAEVRAARSASGSKMAGLVAGLAILSVPLVSWGLYASIGSPSLPDQPLAMRMEKNPANSSVAELVARAEDHLRRNPDDATGWEVLGPIYMRLGRFDDSANAWRNLIRIKGENAARLNGLGEALGAGAQGMVSGASLEAFRKALELEPGNEKSRFFVAVGAAQAGRLEEARAEWKSLSEEAADGSPWRLAALNAIRESGGEVPSAPQAAQSGSASEPRGPSAEDVAAAQEMSASDRQAMIEGMIAQLDDRLKENPDDAPGWQRLIRAYAVMGRTEDAQAALVRGLKAFEGKPEQAGQLTAFAQSLGIAAPAASQ